MLDRTWWIRGGADSPGRALDLRREVLGGKKCFADQAMTIATARVIVGFRISGERSRPRRGALHVRTWPARPTPPRPPGHIRPCKALWGEPGEADRMQKIRQDGRGVVPGFRPLGWGGSVLRPVASA